MDAQAAEKTSRIVGIITGATGVALLVAPRRFGPAGGVHDPRVARWLGAADLALAPGLVVGSPRWPWMAGRAGLNLVMAAHLVRGGTRERAAAASLLAVTVADARVALDLRRAGR